MSLRIPDLATKTHLYVHAMPTQAASTAYAWALQYGERENDPSYAWGTGCTMSGPGYNQQSSILLATVAGIERGLAASRDLKLGQTVVCAQNQALERVFAPTEGLPAPYHEASLLIDSMEAVRGLEPSGEMIAKLTEVILAKGPKEPGNHIRFKKQVR